MSEPRAFSLQTLFHENPRRTYETLLPSSELIVTSFVGTRLIASVFIIFGKFSLLETISYQGTAAACLYPLLSYRKQHCRRSHSTTWRRRSSSGPNRM